ncbi:MAG: hypothetical protein RJQ09_16780, partial [Cyclobacteriaceae bacterium]
SLMIAASLAVLTSCENEFDNAIADPDGSDLAELAAMIRFEEPVLGVTLTPSISFAGILVDPGNNVSSYALRVSQDGGTTFSPFTTVTSFPSDLSITLDATAAALGTTVAAIPPGTQLVFDAVITRNDGREFTSANITGDVVNQGERQAMQFNAFVSCPFVAADAAGDYVLQNDAVGFFLSSGFTATASGTTVTLDDPMGYGFGDQVAIEVDPDVGNATMANQPAWLSDVAPGVANPYGRGSVDGVGFVFACAGIINMDWTFRVAAGSFGSGNVTAQKQ